MKDLCKEFLDSLVGRYFKSPEGLIKITRINKTRWGNYHIYGEEVVTKRRVKKPTGSHQLRWLGSLVEITGDELAALKLELL